MRITRSHLLNAANRSADGNIVLAQLYLYASRVRYTSAATGGIICPGKDQENSHIAYYCSVSENPSLCPLANPWHFITYSLYLRTQKPPNVSTCLTHFTFIPPALLRVQQPPWPSPLPRLSSLSWPSPHPRSLLPTLPTRPQGKQKPP